MQADIAILKDHARITRVEGQWIIADHLDAALAEIEANRTKNVVENVGCDPSSLARKYDWISRQDGGVVRAADVAHDIRENFGIKGEDNPDERDVFASARTLPDPYDDRDGPYYDMKQVRKIKWEREQRLQQDKTTEMISRGAVRDVAVERLRQVEEEGWTPEHDDVHESGELAAAAACYAYHTTSMRAAGYSVTRYEDRPPLDLYHPYRSMWPWDEGWWKPKDRRRDLVRAGALIVAEIERLDRQAAEAST